MTRNEMAVCNYSLQRECNYYFYCNDFSPVLINYISSARQRVSVQ